MKVAVYDTYVPKKSGGIMHFDIIVPEGLAYEKVLEFGKAYLKGADQDGQPLGAKECKFCHTEQASSAVTESVRAQGFHIVEMDGCS